MTAAGLPIEIELKYGVRGLDALERLLDADRLGGLAGGPWRQVEVADRYLETADGALARGGFAARIRRVGDGFTVTLKGRSEGEGPSGTRFRRVELEGPATAEAEPAAWPASSARDRLVALARGAPLIERFTLKQLRRLRDLRGPDGWLELALDHVAVVASGRLLGERDFVEVELRGGDEAILGRLAAILEASGAVTAAGRSKEALAIALLAERAGGERRGRTGHDA